MKKPQMVCYTKSLKPRPFQGLSDLVCAPGWRAAARETKASYQPAGMCQHFGELVLSQMFVGCGPSNGQEADTAAEPSHLRHSTQPDAGVLDLTRPAIGGFHVMTSRRIDSATAELRAIVHPSSWPGPAGRNPLSHMSAILAALREPLA